MKFIAKGLAPNSFLEWKALGNEYWAPSYKELCNPQKADVLAALREEQDGVCCYCERKLEIENSDFHIEHLNPQSAGAGDELDFNNFLCSCLRRTAKGDPLHCGMIKGERVIPITPLQRDCAENFDFTADGKIIGKNRNAQETIKCLALDIPKLNKLREAVLTTFIDPELSDVEFSDYLSKYLSNIGEEPSQFISAVKSVFSEFCG